MRITVTASIMLNGIVDIDEESGRVTVLTEAPTQWGTGQVRIEEGQETPEPSQVDHKLYLDIAALRLVARYHEVLQERVGQAGVFIPVMIEEPKKEDVN